MTFTATNYHRSPTGRSVQIAPGDVVRVERLSRDGNYAYIFNFTWRKKLRVKASWLPGEVLHALKQFSK